jgi:phage repressor protein C with HTH and peptisase S24 domain
MTSEIKMMADEAFVVRLKELVDPTNPYSFAKEVGVGESLIRKYLAGATPGLDKAAQIAKAKGVSLDWLYGLSDQREPIRNPEEQANMVGQSIDLRGRVVSDFAFVQRLDVRASAGNGAVTIHEDTVELLAFQADWLRSRHIKPEAARVLTAKGDSMEPTIRDGDVLLVDTSITSVRDNAIYIVVFNGNVLVKRVNLKRDGSLVLMSDNERHGAEEVPKTEVHDLHIAGRVMWFGRSI